MKTLERYILAEFLKLLAISVSSFIILFVMVDVFENMDTLVRSKAPVFTSLRFFLYKVPFIISQVSPVSVLLSVLLSLGILSGSGELTAVKAGGIRLLRAFVPLFIAGALMSVAVIIVNESVTPAAMKKAESLKRAWMTPEEASSFGREGVWTRTKDAIFNIRELDLKRNELHGVTAYEIERPSFRIRKRIHSRKAVWKDGRWVAERAVVWEFPPGGALRSMETEALGLEGLWDPESMAGVEDIRKVMGFTELRGYVKNLEAEGYEASRYKTDLYGRLTFPFINLIMVFVGIPFALKTGRHGGIASGVGLSVVIGFSYWVVFAAAKSLGSSGVIPPLLAASFPDALFLAAGALMLGYVKE